MARKSGVGEIIMNEEMMGRDEMRGKQRLSPSSRSNNQLPPSNGLVGIHHKLVNHRCALEERANKKKKVLGQC
jgi:hypothetical protein